MPFVEIVGVTSTRKNFCVGFAFLSYERQENFCWMLTQLRSTLDNCMLPHVIVTDREIALIKACKQVFPEAYRLLCRFHIFTNITKHWKQSFPKLDDWGRFQNLWNQLIESPTVEDYEWRYNDFVRRYNYTHPKVIHYLETTWLNDYKWNFVSCWSDKHLNYGNRTTNRVESQHANIKRHLKATNSTLERFIDIIDRYIAGQLGEIKATLERSKMMRRANHNLPILDNLIGKVSLEGLDIIVGEVGRMNGLLDVNINCGCIIRTSCGLPCACMLRNHFIASQPILLDSIDGFWRKLDLSPSYTDHSEESVDYDTLVDDAFNKFKVLSKPAKKSTWSKISAFLNPGTTDLKEPVIKEDNRGRPTTKTNKPSKNEPPRNSSTTFKLRDEDEFDLNKEPPSQPPTQLRKKSLPYMAQIPVIFHNYVTQVVNMLPDGNCGFRSIAVCHGMQEENWMIVRKTLLNELTVLEGFYRSLFNNTDYDDILFRVDWQEDEPAPSNKWMLMPETGIVYTNKFGCIVFSLSMNGCETIFPSWASPVDGNNFPHKYIALCFVNGNHFVAVQLEGEFPMPTPNIYCRDFGNFHKEWVTVYQRRLQLYENLTRVVGPPEFINVG